jgi:DNA-binding CsgD family transcriptional regulator
VQTGALSLLAPALSFLSLAACLHAGDLAAAGGLIEQMHAIAPPSARPELAYAPLALAAWRGHPEPANTLIQTATREAHSRGEGRLLTVCDYATAVLSNGQGDHAAALGPARRATDAGELMLSTHALPELVEAAAHTGQPELAAAAARRLSQHAQLAGTDWAHGLDARARALIATTPQETETRYQQALTRLARAGAALHHARTQMLYGQWLRTQHRRADARDQLRAAGHTLTTRGAHALATQAAQHLRAAGDHTRPHPQPTGKLTPQEARIAQLASQGQSNADIGAQVFISPRTVEYHLSKIFAKLGIESRRQLQNTPLD